MDLSTCDDPFTTLDLPQADRAHRRAPARETKASWRTRLGRDRIIQQKDTRDLQARFPALDGGVITSGDTLSSHAGLLARVAQGDPSAMEEFIGAYGPLVWGIVLKRVRDHSAAEDLTQEIFTEIWKHAGRHDPKIASEAGFVAVIARRRAIDWGRKQQRLPQMETLDASENLPAPTQVPGESMDRDVLWQALSPLPDETRQLFALHFEQGMTHTEISEKTGLPLGSVKTRLRRGLIEARSLLSRLRPGVTPPPPLTR